MHISFKAACSLLLFSALGMPSAGVISPTIAKNSPKTNQIKKTHYIYIGVCVCVCVWMYVCVCVYKYVDVRISR